MNPWEGTRTPPEQRWQLWWAWHPVWVRQTGRRILVFFEPVYRRKIDGQWEYDVAD